MLLLNYKNKISRVCVMNLITITLKCDYMSRRCAFRDGNLKLCCFFNNTISLTAFTLSSFTKNIALPFTIFAVLGHLCIHTWADLYHLSNSSLTFACRTLFHIFSSFAFANFTFPCSLVS